MRKNFCYYMFSVVVTVFMISCGQSNTPKKQPSSDITNNTECSETDQGDGQQQASEVSILEIPVTKKQLSNGDVFWIGGTCHEVSEDGLVECTNKFRNEQNNFIFMSSASMGKVITVLDGNQPYYSFTDNAPVKWVQEISSPTSDDRWVCSTFVYDEDSWIIVYSDNSYKQKGCPDPVIDCISQISEEEGLYCVSFNRNGNWIVSTFNDQVYADDDTKAFLKRAKEKMPQVDFRYFHVSGKGRIASSFDGIYFENIPANMARKIQEVRYGTVMTAFNDEGEFLIGDNGTNYYDACLTSEHVRELKGNLSKFHKMESVSASPSSTVSAPNVRPYPCGICSGTRRCTSCNGQGRYYSHDRYHTCGVCSGSGICTGCNGTGIQTY